MKIHTSLQRYIFAITGVLVGLVTAASLVNYALAQGSEPTIESGDGHILTVYDRGEERVIITKKSSIKEALLAADITVDPQRDVVEPALDTEMVASNYRINIYRARPITVVDGAVRKQITTAKQTAPLIAKDAGMTLYPEDHVRFSGGENLLLDGANRVMTIERATAVELTLYGKKSTVRTHAETVSDLLRDKNIKLGKDDTLSIAASTGLTEGMSIEIWRNGTQTVTVEEQINFPIEKIQDANREIGYREIKEPGKNGTKNVTYDIEMKNGQEVSRKEIASITTKEPVKQVEIVGAKPSFGGDFAAALAKLRSCEGGYNSWNSAGPYYGAYQFDQRTWNSVSSAPYGNATPAEQDAAARALYERRGWQPWPHCGANLPDIYR